MPASRRGRLREPSTEGDEDFVSEGEDELDDSDELSSESESEYEADRRKGIYKGEGAQEDVSLYKQHRAVSRLFISSSWYLSKVLREMSTGTCGPNSGEVWASAEKGREEEEEGRGCDPGRWARWKSGGMARGELTLLGKTGEAKYTVQEMLYLFSLEMPRSRPG
jgi:hypothetical protein